MIIDKEQLISLLEEKTDLEREKVEDQLSQLITRIQQAAEKNKTFEIEGFGTFSMQDDNLQFEPNNTLETEINNKYAGMKPIELIGAFKQPEGDEVPVIEKKIEETEDKAWSFDEEADDKSEEMDKPAAEAISDDEPPEEKEEAEELAIKLDEDQELDISEEESEKVLEKMVRSMEGEPAGPEIPGDEDEAEPQKVSSEAEDHPQKENDITGKLLIAAVVVIAIGLSGWMAYDTGLIGSSDKEDNYSQAGPAAVQQNENGQSQADDEQNNSSESSEASINSEPEQEMAVGTQEDPPPEDATEEAGFGLKGKVNENISSGYTIVVHSLRRLDEAENRKENLQEAGYRALISEADVQGTTYFRVGLGQFETIEDAQQAVSDIPESFQNDQGHFIKRIQ